MSKIAIVGPGAIGLGLTVGAALMEGPHSVVFCARQALPGSLGHLRRGSVAFACHQ